jgi:hypothetical protein
LPEFVNASENSTKATSSNNLTVNSAAHHHHSHIQNNHQTLSTSSISSGTGGHHLNYYYLNAHGKQAIKRILCVYEYHNPHVTYNPGLISITSLLLHYMQEHEVFSALCFMSSTKEHLIDSKASWDTACLVFTRLLKVYCVSFSFKQLDLFSAYSS